MLYGRRGTWTSEQRISWTQVAGLPGREASELLSGKARQECRHLEKIGRNSLNLDSALNHSETMREQSKASEAKYIDVQEGRHVSRSLLLEIAAKP